MELTVQIALIAAAFLCSLVAGFLFAFAVVVMPGIRTLPDAEFIRSFRQMDAVIQRGQPLFGLVWVGSVLALLAALALGLGQLDGLPRVLLMLAGGVYVLGVQLPTMLINVPLNNELQAMDIASADDGTYRSAREVFETRWNRSNRIRTALAAVTTGLLLVVLTLFR
jgi:uncharacterized membrane protein